jgi:hypothetical protein
MSSTGETMKLLSTFLLVLLTSQVLATAKLHCTTYHDGTVVSTGVDSESFYNYCADQLGIGGICFTGSRKGVIELLEEINEWDMYGGEAEIVDIHYAGRTQVAYDILDGPSDTIIQRHKISRCTRSFFADAHQD